MKFIFKSKNVCDIIQYYYIFCSLSLPMYRKNCACNLLQYSIEEAAKMCVKWT